MPRKSEGARLYWRERKDGQGVWEIRDGAERISTRASSRRDAEAALAEHIQRKHRPTGPVAAEEMTIGMCLAIYAEQHAAHIADPQRVGYAIAALDSFWGLLPVSSIKGETCRRYMASRTRTARDGTISPISPGTTRRELGTLQAALNFCHREGFLISAPLVTLPTKPDAKERWLTRQEAAWLIRGARALNRDGRHLQDFILHGLYTGSRKATILAMLIDTPSISGGHVDTVNGILYRKPQGKAETTKRQRPARLPPRYLAHLRRQARRGRRFVVEREVEFEGKLCRTRVGDIRKGWARAIELAETMARRRGIVLDLSDVTPHTLKHTAITWTLQRGATIWDTAGYFSTSAETIQRVYGHHCPSHQATAVAAINRRA